MERMKIILKTDVGIEKVAASRVSELGVSCTSKPGNFQGMVLVDNADLETTIPKLEGIPEITNILPVDAECDSDILQIVKVGTDAALEKIQGDESFAVRTVRRGSQDYSSIDINVALGDSICGTLGCDVNLDAPDKTVYVEIIGKRTYISILPGTIKGKKKKSGTTGRELAGKTSFVQLAYLNESDASTSMGHRIGRAAQAFGVKELILAIQETAGARDLMHFVDGVIKSRETRFKKEKSITSGKANRVPIYVADLYQIVRERQNEPIIITSSLGEQLSQCADGIRSLFDQKNVNVFIGARKGVPTGIFRFADVVVNLCPGLTYATEHGIPAAIVGIAACIQGEC